MTYELVTRLPSGKERVQSYASDDSLAAGDALRLGGRFWLPDWPESERLRRCVDFRGNRGRPVRAVRLTDSGVLGVAGFERVRKYELEVESSD